MRIKKILKVLGIIIGLIILYLITIIFFPVLKPEKQPIISENIATVKPDCIQDVSFSIDETLINAWLYLPDETNKPRPCIILTNGFCGTKDMLLEKYALRFVDAGYAVLSFDYRHFGKSEGEPRQLFSLPKQFDDIKAAVKFVRSRNEINPDKIVIWGTSSSGTYGLAIAAEDKNIAAVIGQSPALDEEANGKNAFEREGLGWMLSLIMNAQRDKGRSRFGLSPHTFPAIGKPGTTAIHTAPGAFEGYEKIAGNSQSFKNEVCARIMLSSHGPDLFESAEAVECPVLFHICEKDNINVPDPDKKIEKILGDKLTIASYPIGHFDIYFGENFEKSISNQISFLKENL